MHDTNRVSSLSEARLEREARIEKGTWLELRESVRSGDCPWLNRLLSIPPRYATKSLANFEGADITRKALSALSHANVFFWGPAGTGKTHLGLGLLKDRFAALASYDPEKRCDLSPTPSREYQRNTPSGWKVPYARFLNCQALINDVKAEISNNESGLALIDELLDLDLVLIDDFAACRLTEL